MKRREKESIRNLKDDEILSQIEGLKKTIFEIKFKRMTAPVSNPVEARTARRKIALMKTILRERELAKEKSAENK
ncbi:MAG: 50S ribosomal protein L29 [Elusimicrobiales bacterium]|nr:50S ribosomal protein L29 [Elusimicrobiales bacterium]